MKKGILFLLLSFSFLSIAFSQKLDRETLPVKYVKLPNTPLPPSITTYSTKVTLPSSFYDGTDRSYANSTLNAALVIPGFTKTEEATDFKISAELYNFVKGSYDTRTIEKEEKRGEEKVKVNYYVYDFTYKMPTYFKIEIKGDIVLDEYVIGSNDYKTETSPMFKNTSERYEWYKKSKTSFLKKVKEDAYNENLKYIKSFLTDNYSYRVEEVKIPILFVKNSKKHNYDDYNAICTEMKEALSIAVVENATFGEPFNQKASAVIAKFETLLKDVDFESKKARLNKKMGAYITGSIAILSYWMNDFDKATQNITLADKYSNKNFTYEYRTQTIEERKIKVDKYNQSRLKQ